MSDNRRTPTRDTSGLPVDARIYIGIAVAAYVTLVVVMWLPFTMMTGFPGETAFSYRSDTVSTWEGFFYRDDPLRIYTNVFYHSGYLLGKVLGVQGSFVPYQVVYALLWLGRGILVLLILRKFLPQHLSFCFLAGVLVLVHASDYAIQRVGQMNQFGFIFWMLLAFYLLVLAVESMRVSAFILLTVAACWCEYLSLWSYEAHLLLILVAPVTLWCFRSASIKRATAASAAWFFVPALYIAETIARYRHSAGGTYQESVLRKSWAAGSIIGDWLFNVGASLGFWNWTRSTPILPPASQFVRFGATGAVVFLMGACAILYQMQRRKALPVRSSAKPLWWALATGIVILFLSFPGYLLLGNARSLWRTQVLSGIGAGISLAALVCLACRFCPNRVVRLVVFLACGAAIAYEGVYTAVVRGAFERWQWERHRRAVAQVVAALPIVQPDTVVIYTGIPKGSDPFDHDMWFDMALRLSYPGIPVAGMYFYDDGTAAPGDSLRTEGDRWKWDGTGLAPLVRDVAATHTVVLEFQAQGPARIVPRLPAILHPSEAAERAYAPQTTIASSTASPLAIRRYGPIPTH